MQKAKRTRFKAFSHVVATTLRAMSRSLIASAVRKQFEAFKPIGGCMVKKKLGGDRNQCAGCGEYFNSSFAFAKHRIGEFGKDRRCMTVEEMQDKKMVKNSADFWVTAANPMDYPVSVDADAGDEHYKQQAWDEWRRQSRSSAQAVWP
jgi:hypothetical protein